jgi:hypothetical protein
LPRSQSHTRNLAILTICLIAAAARLLAFVYLDRVHHPDVWESETIATNLLTGKGFVFETLGVLYRSYMEPLYPFLCALIYRATNHSYAALGGVQILLGTTLVWLVYVCARHVASERAALLAAALTAVHPGLILYTTKFHPFVLDVTLWFAAFAVVLGFSAQRPWRSSVTAGAMIGACVLTRPTILAMLPLVAWWIWRRSTGTPLRRLAPFAVVTICAGLVAAPWVWRNYEVHHRLMLTRSGSSFVFWLGNNPYLFTGSSMTLDGTPVVYSVPSAVRDELARLDELGQQEYFQREADAFVLAHPLDFARRVAIKFWYFWWFTPQAGLLYPALWLRLYQLFYIAVVILATGGVWIRWRTRASDLVEWDATRVMLGVCLSIALLQSVYYVEGRHRLAIEPFLLIFAGCGIDRVVPRRTLAS